MSDRALRDDRWLEARFKHLWESYYSDSRIGYPIEVKFGRPARYRFGSICNHGRLCRILINGVFADPEVPEYVVDATLAHELAHYVHGYGSGLPKLHAHPHRGGVIDKEMQKRGCFFLEEMAGPWRRDNWQAFYASREGGLVTREALREQKLNALWEAFLGRPGCRSEEYLRGRMQKLAPAFGVDVRAFTVEWLRASMRRTGLSYRFRNDNAVRLHACLADPTVPDEVIDYELSYWLAVEKGGGNWTQVERAMKDAGVWERAQKAIRWRRRTWPKYRPAHFPTAD